MRTPSCLTCGKPIAAVSADIDPKAVSVVLRAQCGHPMDRDVADDLWRRLGYRWDVPAVDAAALVIAERARHLTEEGFTPEHDAEHTDGLPWAAWCYIDRAIHPSDSEEPPNAWPWETEQWNQHADSLRRLIIAGALVLAEIDRRLIESRSKP